MKQLRGWVSVREAAAELNYSVSYVHRLIREGRLNASMVGKQYLIHEDDIKAWKDGSRTC